MSRIGILARRLAERRFLKDGASDASLLPGAMSTLALSTLIASLIVGELESTLLAVVAACAVCAWSLLRAVLEAGDQDSDVLDAAILEPLPIARWELAFARALVASIGVTVDAANLTLPLVVMVGCHEGLAAALQLALVVFVALTFGVLIAAPVRRLLQRIVGSLFVAESEGPLRVVVLLSAFVALVRAPEIDWVRFLEAPWHLLPPFSFASAITRGDVGPLAASIAAMTTAFALSAWSGAARTPIVRARRTTTRRWSDRVRRTCRNDVEQAGFDFALASIRTDRTFRARTFPLLAFPFAAIVLAGLDEYDATLVPMSLFGAIVYLVLSEVFLSFSETASGPELLASLPIQDPWSFRIGAEKAYLFAIVLPTYLAIGFGVAAFDLARRDFVALLDHTLLSAAAFLTAVWIVLLAFDRLPGLPFSRPDRALYPDDLTGGAYFALALSTIAALVSTAVIGDGWKVGLLFCGLLLLIRFAFLRKRERCRASTTSV